MSGTGRGKGKTRPKGGSVHQRKLVTRRFDRNRFGHWSGYPNCPAKGKHDAQAHITSCNVKDTVHVHPESFVTSSISVEHEVRGAGACDTCCNRTVAGQGVDERLCPLTQNAEIGVLDDTLPRTCQVWSWRSSIVRDSSRQSSCDTRSLRIRASFRSARKIEVVGRQRHAESIRRSTGFDLENNTGMFRVLEIAKAKCCARVAQDT